MDYFRDILDGIIEIEAFHIQSISNFPIIASGGAGTVQ